MFHRCEPFFPSCVWTQGIRAATQFTGCIGLLILLIPFFASFSAGRSWGQGNAAIVTGAERVFVRRGPGTGFPPFATLANGSTVEVQEMQGEWARIVTASGQVGYVNSTFLALPGERASETAAQPPVATPPESSVATPSPRARAGAAATGPPARADAATVHTLTERNRALESEVRRLEEELTALKRRAEATPAPPAAPPTPPPVSAADTGMEQLRAESARLTAAVDGLQRRLDACISGSSPSGERPQAESTSYIVSPTTLLLAALGLVVGWFAGSSHGRNQERSRRSRIRF